MYDFKRWLFIIVALGGVGVAIYQNWEYATLNFTSCSLNSAFSCSTVAAWAKSHFLAIGSTSIPYSTILPVSGLIWFILSIVVAILAFRSYSEVILVPFLMIGDIFTIYLWYLELDVIHSICPVCLSLYLVSYALTGIAAWIVAT
jgi:uncharacterized membrane protein